MHGQHESAWFFKGSMSMENIPVYLQRPLRPQRHRRQRAPGPVVIEPESLAGDETHLPQALRNALEERWPGREFLSSHKFKVRKRERIYDIYNKSYSFLLYRQHREGETEGIELGPIHGSDEWTQRSLHGVSEEFGCGSPETVMTDSTIWSSVSLDAAQQEEETCV
jgi:hypothetical protein